VDKVRHPDTEITPAEFEAQMQALKDQGIAVISMDDFLAWRHEQKSLPSRCALITIDDGYNVGYTVAWPILKNFGYPFTMFIYTDYVRGGPKSGGGSITWEQLAEMRDAGVSIQSHTVSHPDLRRKKAGASQANYEEWLWNELHGSKADDRGETRHQGDRAGTALRPRPMIMCARSRRRLAMKWSSRSMARRSASARRWRRWAVTWSRPISRSSSKWRPLSRERPPLQRVRSPAFIHPLTRHPP
jgi:hypothetical protein